MSDHETKNVLIRAPKLPAPIDPVDIPATPPSTNRSRRGGESAADWGQPNGAEPQFKPWGPEGDPRKRRRPVAPPARSSAVERLAEVIESWHRELGSKAISDAGKDLSKAVGVALTAVEAVRALSDDEEAEKRQIKARLREDQQAEVTATDWQIEAQRRQVGYEAAYADASKAANRYRAVVSSEVKRLLPKHLETIAAKRSKALEALESVADDIRSATAAVRAVSAAEQSLNASGTHGWHRFVEADRAIHSRADRDLDGLLSYLRRADDAATGAWILDGSESVPPHTRAALAETSGTVARVLLEQAERDDLDRLGHQLTEYTDARKTKPDDLVLTHHIRAKSLPR